MARMARGKPALIRHIGVISGQKCFVSGLVAAEPPEVLAREEDGVELILFRMGIRAPAIADHKEDGFAR